VITYTGKVTNTSTTDKNNGVLLKVVADTGNVGSSLHSVGKSYSGDLTKRGVRLLGGSGSNLGANASSLRCRLVDGSVLESVEALLKRGSLRLVRFILTTLLYELVKGWHDFPPFIQ
jgi:hypothetical protein